MRAFTACHDRDQHCVPLANVIASQASFHAYSNRMLHSMSSVLHPSRRIAEPFAGRIPLTRWPRADVAFVKETFIACFKAVFRFDESCGDRLVVRKFGTSRSIIHRSRALEVFRYQITRD
jgi:hypothetical protein